MVTGMALAVFGLTACVPGIVSLGLGKLICENYDKQRKEIIQVFNQNIQNLIKQWEEKVEKIFVREREIAPNQMSIIFSLVPVCSHKKTNENQESCEPSKDCGKLRLSMYTEAEKVFWQVKKTEHNSKSLLVLTYIIAALATTVLTASFMTPLSPALTITHLLLGIATGLIGGKAALSTTNDIVIQLKPSVQKRVHFLESSESYHLS